MKNEPSDYIRGSFLLYPLIYSLLYLPLSNLHASVLLLDKQHISKLIWVVRSCGWKTQQRLITDIRHGWSMFFVAWDHFFFFFHLSSALPNLSCIYLIWCSEICRIWWRCTVRLFINKMKEFSAVYESLWWPSLVPVVTAAERPHTGYLTSLCWSLSSGK